MSPSLPNEVYLMSPSLPNGVSEWRISVYRINLFYLMHLPNQLVLPNAFSSEFTDWRICIYLMDFIYLMVLPKAKFELPNGALLVYLMLLVLPNSTVCSVYLMTSH